MCIDVTAMAVVMWRAFSWDNPDKRYAPATSKAKPVPAPSNPKGLKKLFINICHSPMIDKAAPKGKRKPGAGGDEWQIPFSLSQPRMDKDSSMRWAEVVGSGTGCV
jgi:hypothetical protein